MAGEIVNPPLRKALDAAAQRNVSVRQAGIIIENRGERRKISLEITPIEGASQAERYYLIVFEEAPAAVPSTAAKEMDGLQKRTPPKAAKLLADTATPEEQVGDLQQQLVEMRESLRTSNEENEGHSA